jgi:hypothetical protein
METTRISNISIKDEEGNIYYSPDISIPELGKIVRNALEIHEKQRKELLRSSSLTGSKVKEMMENISKIAKLISEQPGFKAYDKFYSLCEKIPGSRSTLIKVSNELSERGESKKDKTWLVRNIYFSVDYNNKRYIVANLKKDEENYWVFGEK